MKRLRVRRRRPRPEPGEPFELDVDPTVRQVVQFETGTGASHGPLEILVAFAGAVVLTGLGAIWRALGRRPKGRS